MPLSRRRARVYPPAMRRLALLFALLAVAPVAGCTPDQDASFVGAKGDPGDAGPPGPVGPVGPKGPQGEHGALGANGPVGNVGPVGPAGQDGTDGKQGPAGVAGPVGPMGVPGAVGATGAKGQAGADGAVGPTGPKGTTGAQGVAGVDGVDGLPGIPQSKSNVYEVSFTAQSSGGNVGASVTCLGVNDVLMSGNCQHNASLIVITDHSTNFTSGVTKSGWTCTAQNPSALPLTDLTAYARCISLP